MRQKLSKVHSGPRLPAPGTAEHSQWKRSISRGMRLARRKRRRMGWLTYNELAAETGWAKGALKAMDLKKIRIGGREYVAATEIDRLRAA